MEKSIKVLKILLFIAILCLAILFFSQPSVKAATSAHTVTINGQELTHEYKYLVNGVRTENGTLGNGNCTAQFNSDTGILTLNGYSGGGIQTGHGENLTIKLVGNNKITVNSSYQAWGICNSIDSALTITSDSDANLIINVRSNESVAAGIVSDYNNTYSNDSIIIKGKANIIVDAASMRNKAIGIYAKTPVSIIENASFTVTAKSYYSNPTYVLQSGFDITKPLTINTTGSINLDVSKEPGSGHSYYGYGIWSTSTMLLHNVGTMTIKYPSSNGAAWNASWTIPEKFAVNEGIVDGIKTEEIHSGSGIVHTLTLESAVNMFGKSTGQYFNGDTINIWAISDVSGLNFKGWLASAGLVENSLAENTTYIMPNSNATVTANYSPFASQPKFTKISSSSGNIDYTLNEGFDESGRRLVKSEETAEDDFSSYHDFLSTPYEINKGTEFQQVPDGKYKIAVKHGSKWYYSDIFTVNYDEQIPEDSATDTNEIPNVDGSSKENNIQQNGEATIGESPNQAVENNTNLPKTGEEPNSFIGYLTTIIVLGSIWLGSMLLIDREKKKMAKK